MSIGSTIKSLRKELNMTQIELAEKAKVAVNSIRLYEADKRIPKKRTLKKIATALGIDEYVLLSKSTNYLQTPLLNYFAPTIDMTPLYNRNINNESCTELPEKTEDEINQEAREYAIISLHAEFNDNLRFIDRYGVEKYYEKIKSKTKIEVALDKLNDEGQAEAVKRVEELTEIPRYQKDSSEG